MNIFEIRQIALNKIKETNCDLVYCDLEVVDENMKTLSESYWNLKGFNP